MTLLTISWIGNGAGASATAPPCDEGPSRSGETLIGTPCADRILAPPGVATVDGGGGDDVIVPAAIAASASCPSGCHLGIGSQTFEGGAGDDVVYGQRGNDRLFGGGGDDRLYGGIGDDLLRGGIGADRLSGGFGFDRIDGESGDDYVRGDGTIDEILSSGGGFDTLSYATGIAPGFTRSTGVTGFPSSGGERGVYIDLAKGIGDNGVAPAGGGADEIKGSSFERVIGTPYSDYIAGTAADEAIYGGGGADAIFGAGGENTLHGGADGDRCEDGATEISCENVGGGVVLRDPAKVSVGMALPEGSSPAQLYLTGSSKDDEVIATYSSGPPGVSFALEPGTEGAFDESAAAAGGCEVEPTEAQCPLSGPPDAVVLAGFGGDDVLRADGFPDSTSVVVLGGPGDEILTGGELGEDLLVDGPGADEAAGLGGDDALLNNAGLDKLLGGEGNDLFLSDSLCDGGTLDGGGGNFRDNASWSKLKTPVEAQLASGTTGNPGGGSGEPSCPGGSLDHLQGIEDLEGTSNGDFFYGDSGKNQMLGRPGADTYFALDGDDTILANSGDVDLVIDCGNGTDGALIDLPSIAADPAPSGCEAVNGSPPESFEPPVLLPDVATPSPPVSGDRRPPRTKIVHRPRLRVVVRRPRRRVSFAFTANEPGTRFRCKLDRRPFTPCRSPRAYRVRPGGHAFRVFAIDAAGNRDRSPALFRFSIRRR